MLNLALLKEFLHRTCYILDRHVRIDAVLVEGVDAIVLKAFQHSVRRDLDVLGTAGWAILPTFPLCGASLY